MKDTGGKPSRLDQPERHLLVGQLTDMYGSIDAALTEGELTVAALRRAQIVGRATLDRYEQRRDRWQVYAELTMDTYSDLHETTVREGFPCIATNIVGDVSDVELYENEENVSTLALVIEANGLAQYDRYSIPVARTGDTIPRHNRPVDMPELIRERYSKRLSKEEMMMTRDFYTSVDREGMAEDDLMRYLQNATYNMSDKKINHYFTALNLDIEDTAAAGCPYWVAIHDAMAEVIYDHGQPMANAYTDYIEGGAWYDLVRIDHSVVDGSLESVGLIVCPQDNDQLLRVPMGYQAALMLYRPDIG